MLIVMYLARATGGKSENSCPPHVHISRIIEYMHKHFNERISIEKLADNAGMSMSSLLRHFKRITGSSPKEYQARLRINYACELLDNTRLSMDEIAFNAGFHDGSHFSNELKKLTGVSPSKYRTDRQNKIHQT
jgi:transcriptional regulator GlxA family with amidase domain